MSEPFLSEIRIMSFNFAPRGWALCNGQTLPISQNLPLFSLLGAAYGGDGVRTFAVPNLQGRVPMHAGGPHPLASTGGEQIHTLTGQEMPTHTHPVSAVNGPATLPDPTGHYLASTNALYQPGPPNTNLAATTITSVGGSQPHENRQPYLALTFAIALQGTFPSRT